MSVQEFVNSTTVARPGAGLAVADLRARYIAQYGAVGRAVFLAGLTAAGVQCITPENRPTYAVGLTWAPQGAVA
jgi:hypothetical protein